MRMFRCLSMIFFTFFFINFPVKSFANGFIFYSSQPISFQSGLNDGIYLGGGLGIDLYKIHQTIELIDENGTLIDESLLTLPRGFVSQIFLGYGQYFCWFYLGGEVFAKYSTTKSSINLLPYNADMSVRNSVGASLLPGIKITPCLLIYARVGYDRVRFKITESGTLLGNDNRTEWANAIDIGIGFEKAIYPHLSLRGEYKFINFGDFRTKFNTFFSPKGNELMLDFIYHFAC
jgi:hypothetical protein